jgi:proline iminopeptidase
VENRPLFADLRENTTWDLISDIEQIRAHLEIENCAVFGGSWGSTLLLAYAQKHPVRVNALFLPGIFMLRKKNFVGFIKKMLVSFIQMLGKNTLPPFLKMKDTIISLLFISASPMKIRK